MSSPSLRDDISFVVLSCDKYADLWDPFFHCLEKYWPDRPFKLFLVTNCRDYNRHGVSVIKLGADNDAATNILTAIRSVPSSWLILWLEDLLITSTVDTSRLLELLHSATAEGACYFKLSADTPLATEAYAGKGFGSVPKGVRYRSAIGTALYHRDTLTALLTPGMSIWEIDKSTASDSLEAPFMALTRRESMNPPIRLLNSVVKGKWTWGAAKFLTLEGFAHVLPGRGRQSIWEHLYIQLFVLHARIAHLLYRA